MTEPWLRPFADNPRYLEWRRHPMIAVGVGEAYGAVLNADFDYLTYLDGLAAAGLNRTRVHSGFCRQVPRHGAERQSSLAPRKEAYLCPWRRLPGTEHITPARTEESWPSTPIWDVAAWDERYWTRLADFCQAAGKRGIVVEHTLFTSFLPPTQPPHGRTSSPALSSSAIRQTRPTTTSGSVRGVSSISSASTSGGRSTPNGPQDRRNTARQRPYLR